MLIWSPLRQIYTCGHDRHLIFHHAFQMELNPVWTTMVLQRFGDVPGPESLDDEVTDVEVAWFIEGLQHACYYMPQAEKRLAELADRFEALGSDYSVPRSESTSPSLQ